MGEDIQRPSGQARALTLRIGEVAESTVRELVPAATEEWPDAAPQVDPSAAFAGICRMLELRPPDRAPSMLYLGPLDWALRSLEGALPTLRVVDEMWQREARDPDEGHNIGRVFGPVVGKVVAAVAGRSLGDFDAHLPARHPTDALALPMENLQSMSASTGIPLASLVRWSIASSIVGRLLTERTTLGARLSLLAARYQLGVKTYLGGAFESEALAQAGSGSFDMDRLVGTQTARQVEIATKLARLSAAIDSMGLLAWRAIDPDHTSSVEDRLVESLRRRRALLSPAEMAAEFWLGTPIGAVINPEVDRFVREHAGSPGGLASLCRAEGTAEIPDTGLVKAGESPIPGRPRTASLTAWPKDDVPEVLDGLPKLEARLRTALGSASNSGRAEYISARIDGLSTPVAERTAAAVSAESVNRRSGLFTSWLQLWLMGHGVTLDGRLEQVSAIYAAVAATDEGLSLLRSRDDTDLRRLHVRATIYVERACGRLESELELALFLWLGAVASKTIGTDLLVRWQVAREQRLLNPRTLGQSG
jgi:hypothetical protein